MARKVGSYLHSYLDNKMNCYYTGGKIASPNKKGHPLSVPRRPSTPRICETKRPTVTASWLMVPRPPLRLNGDISDMYIGTREVLSPGCAVKDGCYHSAILLILVLTAIDTDQISTHDEQFVRFS